ncbi:hypothetical protein H2201_001814 [Coniosporium apollinis]|uniref:Uncharacterized protein n=2 Tax=Coniosporium TaxID=2810619 RepID=A0ABQ9P174_9PEZI|nr:hypothetical protein H2199_000450 [Cladosporium sp. JES 115]KAJ9668008.1 hypothetical protein H2201_001814 [Coniosporium apollinis]
MSFLHSADIDVTVMTPAILERRSVVWANGNNNQSISALCLTSVGKHYIDIHVQTSTVSGQPELPNEGGPTDRLEWGSAGGLETVSESLLPQHGFTRFLRADIINDPSHICEGDWFHVEAANHYIERGHRPRRPTGHLTHYEEIWEHIPVQPVKTGTTNLSIVLTACTPTARGMVIRTAHVCQGILRINDEVTVERWCWKPRGSRGSRSGNWERVLRLGRLYLPCHLAMEAERWPLRKDSLLEYDNLAWHVTEVDAFIWGTPGHYLTWTVDRNLPGIFGLHAWS